MTKNQKYYVANETVTLTAVPRNNCCYRFVRWEYNEHHGVPVPPLVPSSPFLNASLPVTVTDNIGLTAVFERHIVDWPLTIIANNNGLLGAAESALEEWNEELFADHDGPHFAFPENPQHPDHEVYGAEDTPVCGRYVPSLVACADVPTLLDLEDADEIHATSQEFCGVSDWDVVVFDDVGGPGSSGICGSHSPGGRVWVENPSGPNLCDDLAYTLGHELGHYPLPGTNSQPHVYAHNCTTCDVPIDDESTLCLTNEGINWRRNIMGYCVKPDATSRAGRGRWIHDLQMVNGW